MLCATIKISTMCTTTKILTLCISSTCATCSQPGGPKPKLESNNWRKFIVFPQQFELAGSSRTGWDGEVPPLLLAVQPTEPALISFWAFVVISLHFRWASTSDGCRTVFGWGSQGSWGYRISLLVKGGGSYYRCEMLGFDAISRLKNNVL